MVSSKQTTGLHENATALQGGKLPYSCTPRVQLKSSCQLSDTAWKERHTITVSHFEVHRQTFAAVGSQLNACVQWRTLFRIGIY